MKKTLISKTGKDRKKLEKNLNSLWAQAVKTRDKKCRYCGSDQKLSAHHIRVYQHLSTRYNINNGLTLCWRCHSLQKLNPELFYDRIIEIIGQQHYNALRLLSNINTKYSVDELLKIKEQLEYYIKQYG